MSIDKAEKLKAVLALLQNDTVKPSDIEQFLATLINVIKQTNDSFKSLSAENIQEIRNVLSYISVEHKQVLKEIDAKGNQLQGTFEGKIKAVERLLSDIRDNPPVDGKDGADGQNPNPQDVVPLVLKQIPPLDSGEQIVEKINDLEIEPEKQIDAKHIKGLPKQIKQDVIAFQRNIAYYDETTYLIENPTKIKFAGSGVSIALDSEGAVVVTVTGGAGNNEAYEQATNSGDDLNFTILHAPVTNTLIVINGNTGQIYMPTTDYTLSSTTITFINAQTGVTVMARYSYA